MNKKTAKKTVKKTTAKKRTTTKTQRPNKKKANPLYVVTNKGKDVESANNYIEALFKKAGLGFLYQFIIDYYVALLGRVNSYAMLTEVKKLLDQLVARLQSAMERLQGFSFLS